MATFLGSSPAFLARPAAKPHISCAPPSRPPSAQQPSEQPPPPPPQQQPMQAQAQAQPQPQPQPQPQAVPARAPKRAATSADSTDWVASSLTRRFGIGAGLAWVGFLAFGVVSEQLKTRFEVAQQQANTKSGCGGGAGGRPAQWNPVHRDAGGRWRRGAAGRPGGDRPAGAGGRRRCVRGHLRRREEAAGARHGIQALHPGDVRGHRVRAAVHAERRQAAGGHPGEPGLRRGRRRLRGRARAGASRGDAGVCRAGRQGVHRAGVRPIWPSPSRTRVDR